jgi:dipeptidyl-peptidase 4
MRMRRSLLSLIPALLLLAALSPAQEKKTLTFDQIFKNGEPKLTLPLPGISGWADDRHYIESKREKGEMVPRTFSVDVSGGKSNPWHVMDAYKSLVDSAIDLNSPESSTESFDRLIYRHQNHLFLLDTRQKTFRQITNAVQPEKNPVISPDGRYCAYTRENDLYVADLNAGTESRVTSDGGKDIHNGYAAWVYYEEIFGRPTQYRAFWWSPDSRHLAFYRFDESAVPLFPVYNADGLHGNLEQTHYPEAGDPNPKVRIGIIPAGKPSPVVWADFNENDDQYFGTPFWTPDGKDLIIQWMNRRQDSLLLWGINPSAGSKKLIYTEHQPSWVEWFESIDFLGNNKGFILRSDKDGWSHLYLHAMDGSLIRRLTSGNWSVTDVKYVDESGERVYFTAKKEASTSTDLYVVGLDGTGLKRLTSGPYNHSVQLSPKGSYFITTYSNLTTPPKMALCDRNGKIVRELGDSKTSEFDNFQVALPELVHVNTPDGYALPVTVTLPLNFDSTAMYPVLISIYGGPASPSVYNSWGGLRNQWLAREGVIQVAVDHRGSGHFGKAGESLMYRHLGEWEMNDYIEVVKWLRRKPYVDSTRVGITGGSYGGYVTCLALTKGAGWFTHGIALFSVTDFRLYDSHYTERYMDTPAADSGGYAEASVTTYADKYKGLLRIVHGTMDDNVHMQNSIQLVDKLEDLGKHFEFMMYPGGRHGWGGPKATQLRNETYRFYYQYLIKKDFPASLFEDGSSMRRMPPR